MPTIDLVVFAKDTNMPYAQKRLRPQAGSIVSFRVDVTDTGEYGNEVLVSDLFRIVRVHDLAETDAIMLCAYDEVSAEDIGAKVLPRYRLHRFSIGPELRLRNKDRKTAFDVEMSRDELFAAVQRRPDEIRNLSGLPMETHE